MHPFRTLAATSCLALAAPAQLGITPAIPVSVPLPGDGHDVARDAARGRLYVSVPSQNRIVVISATTFQPITDVVLAPRPSGIDISHDGSTLFVALNQGSAVAYLDLDTLTVTDTVSVGAALENSLTWDVAEAKPDWIFVSANPYSAGFAKIALIRRDLGNSTTTVASNRIIRAGPTFAKDPTQQFLYVGESFSPESLYKLDLAQPTAPIVLEDQHGSVSGTQHAEVNQDGTRIYLRSGQILDTQTFLQTGVVGAGASRLEPTGQRVWVMPDPGTLQAWNTTTQLQERTAAMPCQGGAPFEQVVTFVLWPDETTALALFLDHLCGLTTTPLPSLAHVEPPRTRFDSGPVPVALHGAFFDRGGAVTVRFGGTPATDVVVVDGGTIMCTAPAADPGFVDVEVGNANGTSILAGGFAYTPALALGGDLRPGGFATFRMLNSPVDLLQVFFGFGPPVAVTLPGIAGTLCLPQAVLWLWIPVWVLDEFPFATPIPNDPVLHGFTLLVQGAAASPQPPVTALTDCVTVTIQ